jgi:hypothetical protein
MALGSRLVQLRTTYPQTRLWHFVLPAGFESAQPARRCGEGSHQDLREVSEMRFSARRLLLLGAVLAALAMLMTPAFAGADDDDDDDGGRRDRAFCAPAGPLAFGQCFVPGRLDFDFRARSGPLGQKQRGKFRFESLPLRADGRVTCLQVTGNRASVGGRITAGNPPSSVGRGFAFTVVDNTPAGPDMMSGWPVFVAVNALPMAPAPNTPNCGDPLQPTQVVTGNIVVKDRIVRRGDDDDDDDD